MLHLVQIWTKMEEAEGGGIMNRAEKIKVVETIESICDKWCKFSGTATLEGCEYVREHNGSCYLDDLMSIIVKEETSER